MLPLSFNLARLTSIAGLLLGTVSLASAQSTYSFPIDSGSSSIGSVSSDYSDNTSQTCGTPTSVAYTEQIFTLTGWSASAGGNSGGGGFNGSYQYAFISFPNGEPANGCPTAGWQGITSPQYDYFSSSSYWSCTGWNPTASYVTFYNEATPSDSYFTLTTLC